MKEFSEIAKSTHISNDAIVEYPIHCGPNSQIHGGCNVGQFTFINISSVLYPNVKIGRFCSIARNCEIGVARHPVNFLSTHSFQYHFAQFPKHPFYKNGINRTSWRAYPDTIIGSDVWIGAQSIVKAGVNIGHGAIIAANSVVTKNIAPYSIVGGSPAKVIRMRFNAEQISKLLELRWWELSLEEISDLEFGNIDSCIESLLKIRRIEHL